MLRWPLLIATVAAALVAIGAAGAGASRVAAAAPAEIRLISVAVKTKDTDLPPKGASKGDRTVGSSELFNGVAQFGKKAGAKVGSDRSVFVLRSAKTLYGSGTATLPGGTIHFQGVATVKEGVFSIPVTRGTGVFAGARGQLLIPVTEPGTKLVANVYRLTYQPAA